jgi:hypothetical protein
MIPFSAWQGLVVIVGLIFLFFPWKKWGIARWILLASLVVLVLLHVYPSQHIPSWSVCFKRTVAPETLKTPCEPSAQFRDGSTTFKVSSIDWAEDFIPLYFMNDKQVFNFYKDTEPDRKHLPYSFVATTTAQGGKGNVLRATTTLSEVVLVVDGISSHLTANNPLTIPLIENRSYPIEARYDQVRTSRDALTLSAPLARSWKDVFRSIVYGVVFGVFLLALAYEAWNTCGKIATSSRRTLALLLFPLLILFVQDEIWGWVLFLGFLAIWYLYASSKEEKITILPALVFLAFHVSRSFLTSQPLEDIFVLYAPVFLAYLLLIASFCVTALPKQGRKILPWVFALLLINAFAYTQHVNPYGKLLLFTGGDDELTHEGFARESLLATTWKSRLIAGESYHFYYQPFYRYAVALIHSYWGESMFGVFVIQTFLLSVGFTLLLHALSLIGISYAPFLFALLFAISTVLPSQSLLTVVQRSFQQGLGTPLLFISSALAMIAVIKGSTTKFLLLTGLVIGCMVSIRTDYIPAALVMVLSCCLSAFYMKGWQKKGIAIAVLLLSTAIFPALVVARNVYIDGTYILMPTSGLYNLTDPYGNVFKGQNIKEIGTGTALFTILSEYRTNLKELFRLFGEQLTREFVTTLPIRQILWYGALPAFGVALFLARTLRGRLSMIALFLIPLMLILPNLFFVQHNGVAMRGHYDVYWMALLALGIGSLLSIAPSRSIFTSSNS